MLVLGLDPGSQKCGWALLRTDGSSIWFDSAGVIELAPRAHKFARMKELRGRVLSILVGINPDQVAMEAGFFGGFNSLVISETRGVLGELCAERNLVVAEYQPATVKKAATGRGGSKNDPVTKQHVQVAVASRFGQTGLLRPDAADAVAVALCHAHHLSGAMVRTPRPAKKTRRTAQLPLSSAAG